MEIKLYEPWEYCKLIKCNHVNQAICGKGCEVYDYHQYLRDNGQILEAGSELADIVNLIANISPDRLQEICAAEAEGRLKILPCKPGDKVYRLCGTKNNRYIGERIANAITFNYSGETVIFSTVQDVLGKTVFLTKEEAGAALKEETP